MCLNSVEVITSNVYYCMFLQIFYVQCCICVYCCHIWAPVVISYILCLVFRTVLFAPWPSFKICWKSANQASSHSSIKHPPYVYVYRACVAACIRWCSFFVVFQTVAIVNSGNNETVDYYFRRVHRQSSDTSLYTCLLYTSPSPRD